MVEMATNDFFHKYWEKKHQEVHLNFLNKTNNKKIWRINWSLT